MMDNYLDEKNISHQFINLPAGQTLEKPPNQENKPSRLMAEKLLSSG